jgi:hypothetical protein
MLRNPWLQENLLSASVGRSGKLLPALVSTVILGYNRPKIWGIEMIYWNCKAWREDTVNSVAMPGNNRAAVFSMRSVPATIEKLFRPMVNSVTRQRCINKQQQTDNRKILGRVFFMVRPQAIYQDKNWELVSYWGVICEMIWSDLLIGMKRFKDGIIIGFRLGLESE